MRHSSCTLSETTGSTSTGPISALQHSPSRPTLCRRFNVLPVALAELFARRRCDSDLTRGHLLVRDPGCVSWNLPSSHASSSLFVPQKAQVYIRHKPASILPRARRKWTTTGTPSPIAPDSSVPIRCEFCGLNGLRSCSSSLPLSQSARLILLHYTAGCVATRAPVGVIDCD
jgi:hypothetical protein